MIKQLLTIPFHSNFLVANLVFSFIFSYLAWSYGFAGLLGYFVIPAVLAFSAIFVQYNIDVGHSAMLGKREPAIYTFKFTNHQALILATVISTVFFWLESSVEGHLFSILLILITPAIISSFMVHESVMDALNPTDWLSYVWLLKWRYLSLVLLLVLAGAIVTLIPGDWWLLPKIYLAQTCVLWFSYSLGFLLHHFRDELQLQLPLTDDEQQEIRQAKAMNEQFEHISDRWHRLATVREMTQALNSISDYLDSKANGLEDWEQVMTELCSWRTKRLAVLLLPRYLEKLIQMNKAARAYARYHQLVESEGKIAIEAPQIRESILQFAMELGHHDIVDFLNESESQNPKAAGLTSRGNP